jgi:WD40 repeat protein
MSSNILVIPDHSGLMHSNSMSPAKFLQHSQSHKELDLSVIQKRSMREEMQTVISYFGQYKPHELTIPFQGTCLQVSAERGNFYFGTREGKLVVARILNKEITHEVDLKEGPIRSIALYQNDAYLFTGGLSGVIKKFDMSNMKEISNLEGHTGEVEDILVSKDESTLYSLGENGQVFKWDIQLQHPRPIELYHHEGQGCGMDLSSDNKFLSTCGTDQITFVFNLNSGKIEKKVLNPSNSTVRCVKITELNRFLAFGDDKCLVHLFEFGSWELLFTFRGHSDKVKAIEGTFDEKFIISGGSEGKIMFWSTENKHEGLELDGHEDGVKALILFEGSPYLYSMSDDNRIITWKIPDFDHAFHVPLQTETKKLRDILPCMNDKDCYFLVYKTEVVKVHRHFKSFKSIFQFDLNRIVCFGVSRDGKKLLIVKTNEKVSRFRQKKKLKIGCYWIAVYNLEDESKLKEFEIESYGIYTCVFSNDENFIFIGELNHCKVIRYDNGKEHHVYKGHKSEVCCVLQSPNSKLLFTGDTGGSIKSFNYETNEEIRVLNDGIISTTGLCITNDNDFMIASYENAKVNVWDCFKMIKINSIVLDGIKEMCCSASSNLIFCLFSSKIKVIDIPTLIPCYEISLTGKSSYFCFNRDEDEIAIYMKDKIGFYLKPDKFKSLEVCGDYTKTFQFYHKMGKLVSGKLKDHSPILNNWIIEPFHLNITHIYAYLDLNKLIPELFSQKVGYFSSFHGYSPLEISLKMDFEKTTSAFFAEFKKQVKTNPLFFSYLENALVQINKSPFTSVHKFYKFAILKSIDTKLPRFCTVKDKLPIIIHSPTLLAHRTSFLPYESFSNDGIELNFKQTFFKVNMIPGSSESLELLTSIIDSENDLLLATEFISLLLNEKWKKVRFILYAQTFIYLNFLVFLAIYAIYGGEFIFLAFGLNVALIVYEIIQGIFGGLPYFEDPWNYIDILRAILKTLLFIDHVVEFTTSTHILLAAVIFVSFVRGISYFRIMSGTRYYVNLIYEVIFDIIPFLIVLFYTTLSFSLIFRVLKEKDESQFFYLTASWEINVGGFDTSNYGIIMYLAFFLHTVINPLIMLNLLISILGDTFERVSEKTVVADCKELAGMVLECELLYIMNRNKTQRSYIHICEGLKDTFKTDNSMMRKLKDKLKSMRTLQKTMIAEIQDLKNQQIKGFDEIKEIVLNNKK